MFRRGLESKHEASKWEPKILQRELKTKRAVLALTLPPQRWEINEGKQTETKGDKGTTPATEMRQEGRELGRPC